MRYKLKRSSWGNWKLYRRVSFLGIPYWKCACDTLFYSTLQNYMKTVGINPKDVEPW